MDIVERLRLLVPSDSSGAAFDAVNEITRLATEVEDLSNRLHHVHRLWANNEHALRADNATLTARVEELEGALEVISMMDISWVGDAFKLKDIASAALFPAQPAPEKGGE